MSSAPTAHASLLCVTRSSGARCNVHSGFVDLHCHWVSGIDDGARSPSESGAILGGLSELGFTQVLATPHMRPGMFENSAQDLERAYCSCVAALDGKRPIIELGLSCEHYLDDVVLGRLLRGEGCPYPGGKAALVECPSADVFPWLGAPLRNLMRVGIRPVLAHPERLSPLWHDPERLQELIACGAAPLLDLASIAGRHGSRAQECAWALLELGLYDAACSDAHRPTDITHVAAGLNQLQARFGTATVEALLIDGPLALLRGARP